MGQDLINNGISYASIDSAIDQISHENHNNIADNSDKVSLSSERTQTGIENESNVSLANKVHRIDATGNNTHSAVNCRQGGHGVRTHGGYGRGIRTRCCGEGARSTGQGAGGHGVQANQTRRCGNGHGGARLPL